MDLNEYCHLTEDELGRAESMTVEEVIEDGFRVIIDIAYQNGLNDETINYLLERLLTERKVRRFKVLD